MAFKNGDKVRVKNSFLQCRFLCHYFSFHFVWMLNKSKFRRHRASCFGVRMLDSGSGFSYRNVSQIPWGPAWAMLPAVAPQAQTRVLKWRPFKNNKGKIQLLHRNSSTKTGGKNRFHISHKHRSYCGCEECMSQTRADNDYCTNRASAKN